jgi:hypothetical protein
MKEVKLVRDQAVVEVKVEEAEVEAVGGVVAWVDPPQEVRVANAFVRSAGTRNRTVGECLARRGSVPSAGSR